MRTNRRGFFQTVAGIVLGSAGGASSAVAADVKVYSSSEVGLIAREILSVAARRLASNIDESFPISTVGMTLQAHKAVLEEGWDPNALTRKDIVFGMAAINPPWSRPNREGGA